ncbi:MULTISPECIES: helix-turn-helix domain-containing protein [unclassified Bacillus (in: firmicutes)]|uniref:helix-turn-helix domain-containing protein n=1 Tax=unclassified Bacillus (in: firmicutes) TaxID=185979 RepID=UPI0008E39881|nr:MULTISPECIES: helix-turn-helix domain-containing protein [unclassified Bacillus (in: firmicutes)]SFI03097.1 Helix-turn-helix domain-containing protein [Bacillus sp. 71mf]SFS81291.1 Helix-turn-helix domain-containing protein [Bacillus sp. 103mf]
MLSFDVESFRQIIREEVERATVHIQKQNELPPFLTVTELMELLHIKRTKASELLNRSDFPVFREAGVLIPTHLLFQWIEKHTSWVEENTEFYNKQVI